jgi:hypothetical protein
VLNVAESAEVKAVEDALNAAAKPAITFGGIIHNVATQYLQSEKQEVFTPEPPTPTSRAWPASAEMMRAILHTCFMASSNKTKSITGLISLYSLRAS